MTFIQQPGSRLQQGTVIVAHACHAVDEKTRCLKGSGRDGILEDFPDDPTGEELKTAIDQLTDEEVIDLIALTWVGRGDFDRSSWQQARVLATERHRRRSSNYLMGIPNLADYLEEGLAELGHNLEAYSVGRL